MGHWREVHCRSRKVHATAAATCLSQARSRTRDGKEVQTIKTMLDVRRKNAETGVIAGKCTAGVGNCMQLLLPHASHKHGQGQERAGMCRQ